MTNFRCSEILKNFMPWLFGSTPKDFARAMLWL